MKKLAQLLVLAGLLFLLLVLPSKVYAQGEVITHTAVAIKAGSSRDLTRYFNESVEISFDGDMSSFSKTQAEFVIKDFFKRNPAQDFKLTHEGARDGFIYAIGRYYFSDGSYLVFTHIRKHKGQYVIHRIDFTKQ
jgi:hypothetical protein